MRRLVGIVLALMTVLVFLQPVFAATSTAGQLQGQPVNNLWESLKGIAKTLAKVALLVSFLLFAYSNMGKGSATSKENARDVAEKVFLAAVGIYVTAEYGDKILGWFANLIGAIFGG